MLRWKRSLSPLAIAVGLLLSAQHSRATTVRAVSLKEKTQVSSAIVHGIVKNVRAEWEVPNKRIQTLITIEVKETIKGNIKRGHQIVVRRVGGTIDTIAQGAPGMSEYERGEEVVMFLSPDKGRFVAVGVGIGKYEVESSGKEKWVVFNPTVAVVRVEDGKPRITRAAAMAPEPLHNFLDRLRTYVSEAPKNE